MECLVPFVAYFSMAEPVLRSPPKCFICFLFLSFELYTHILGKTIKHSVHGSIKSSSLGLINKINQFDRTYILQFLFVEVLFW